MVFTRINNARKKLLENLIARDFETASEHFKHLAKHCYSLALAAKDKEIKKGLVYEGDMYVGLAKKIQERKKETKSDQKKPQITLSEKKWVPESRPDINFSDIAGLDDVKNQVMLRMVIPHTNKAAARRYNAPMGGGMLLYGPGGTGKTTVAKAVAGELDIPFFNLDARSILVERSAEGTTENIRAIFAEAEKYERILLYFDEIEYLVPVRATGIMKHVVREFLVQLEGSSTDKEGLLVIGSTNRPWEIRPEVIRSGRFDSKIYVGLPDLDARKELFHLNLEGPEVSKKINYTRLAELTEKYSGADIKSICQTATLECLAEHCRTGKDKKITADDIEAAIASTPLAPANPYDLQKLEEFRNGFSGRKKAKK
ncbi:ATP-binding protein [Candidatus Woesearchaeota archaeon]|nr:ATP-binding protein [Candidatus Woesearchaeota archaeon]